MWRRCARITGVADITDDVAGIDHVTLAETSIPLEVRIVMHLPARTENIYDLSAESICADAHYDSICRAQYRRSAFCKNVHALVRSSAASRIPPRIRDLALHYSHHGHSHGIGRTGCHQLHEENRMAQNGNP